MPSLHLLSLPEELLVHEILARLPYYTIFRCLLTCKSLHCLITKTALVEYKMRLEVAEMVNNPRTVLPLEQRLKMLREFGERWRSEDFDFFRTHNLLIRKPQGRQYFFDGGVMIFPQLPKKTTTDPVTKLDYFELPGAGPRK